MRSKLSLIYSRTSSDEIAFASHPHLAFFLSAIQSTNKHFPILSRQIIETITNAAN